MVDQPMPGEGAPEWWLLRLLERLQARYAAISVWEDYYAGRQPLSFASEKFREAFGSRFPAFTSNFCSLVVDTTAERLEVAGFRFGSPEASRLVWDEVWQANDLDAGSQQAHQEALIKGTAYALVEPGDEGPTVTIEDAFDAIVACDPRNHRTRLAGLKRWVDESGRLVAYLYTPEYVFKYRSTARWAPEWSSWWLEGELGPTPTAIPTDPGSAWYSRSWGLWGAAGFKPYALPGEEWPLPNRLEAVPLVELPNRPRLKAGGVSEIAPIRSNQDAVNKYRTDALIASEFAAFPQRYLLNYEPERDEDTGQAVEPFRAAIDRLWTLPPPDPENPDAKDYTIGQFAAASLEPYVRMIELEVGHIGSISRLPYATLLPSPTSSPPSGESTKADEAGLLRKLGRTKVFLGEGWEEVMRLGLVGLQRPEDAKYRQAETIWRDDETRNEAVRTDAVVKLHAERIIDNELSWELVGLTSAQIEALREREEARKAEQQAEDEAAAAAARAAAASAPAPGQPPSVTPAPFGPRMGTGEATTQPPAAQ